MADSIDRFGSPPGSQKAILRSLLTYDWQNREEMFENLEKLLRNKKKRYNLFNELADEGRIEKRRVGRRVQYRLTKGK